MKIFICEFITAGGLNRADLPPSLVREGTMMRDALLRDLSLLPEIVIITTHDARLSSPISNSVPISAQDDAWVIWQDLLQNCDAAFIIAPETDNTLADLVNLVNHCNVLHLGCSFSAIKLASSKYQTFQQLVKAGINVVATYRLNEFGAKEFDSDSRRWVAKPDDGAGCDDTAYLETTAEVEQWLNNSATNYVIQPYIEGVAASISMLCKDGKAWLLSCNQQKVELVNKQFVYSGSVVNGLQANDERFDHIAQQISSAMPDLAGYVGVDVIVSDDKITVLEINPRLTTSFAGLHASLGINPSKLILELFFNPLFTMLPFNKLNNKPVEITV